MPPENGAEGEQKHIDVKPPEAAEKPKGAEAPPQSTPAAKSDPFADALKSAQRTLGELDDEEKPAKKPAKKAEPKPEEKKPAKPEKKADEKPAEKAPKPAKAKDDAGDEDDAEDDDETPAKPAKPLQPKRSWSAKRQEDFQYLTPEAKAEWLAEPTRAPDHWTPEEKADFDKIADEGMRDHYVAARKSFERGYQGKFDALAGERKTFAEIQAAVPPGLRQAMQQRGISEAAMFKTLVGLQEKSMSDPIGYVADFIGKNKVDLQKLADRLDAAPAQPQGQAPDVRNHPEFRQMADRVAQLEGHINGQIEERKTTIETESSTALQKALTETDEGGELRYPLARVLSYDMADLLENDPDTFEGMSFAERFDLAYRTALDSRPELHALKKSKTAAPAAEREGDDEDAEDDREAKLKRAKSRKSNGMTPSTGAGGGDPFSKAYASAKSQSGFA